MATDNDRLGRVGRRGRTPRSYMEKVREVVRELPHSHRGRRWLVFDFAIGFGAAVAAFYLSGRAWETSVRHVTIMGGALIWGVALSISASLSGLNRSYGATSKYEIIVAAGISLAVAVAIEAVFLSAILYYRIGRVILFLQVLVSFVGLVLLRMLLIHWVRRYPKRVALYSPDGRAGELTDAIESRAKGYQIVGIVSDTTSGEKQASHTKEDFKGQNDLLEICEKSGAQELVYCNGRSDSAEAGSRVARVMRAGIPVSTAWTFSERLFCETPPSYLPGDWPFYGLAGALRDRYRFFRNTADMVAALLLGVTLAPVWLTAAVAVRVFLGKPVVYRQPRIGLGGKVFEIYKLRTMRNDQNGDAEERFSYRDDPRVTFLGKILRRGRIDELPQLLNILKGDMVLIGPRPEQPGFAAQYERELPFYCYRHLVKPGITGWAQVKHSYTDDVEGARRKLGYDLYYIRHMSPKLDIEVALRTAVFLMRGAV